MNEDNVSYFLLVMMKVTMSPFAMGLISVGALFLSACNGTTSACNNINGCSGSDLYLHKEVDGQFEIRKKAMLSLPQYKYFC